MTAQKHSWAITFLCRNGYLLPFQYLGPLSHTHNLCTYQSKSLAPPFLLLTLTACMLPPSKHDNQYCKTEDKSHDAPSDRLLQRRSGKESRPVSQARKLRPRRRREYANWSRNTALWLEGAVLNSARNRAAHLAWNEPGGVAGCVCGDVCVR